MRGRNDFIAIQYKSLLLAGTKECKLPGCNNKCYITNYGLVYDFCGHSHATLYEQQFSQGTNYCMISQSVAVLSEGTYKIKTCKLPGCCKKCFVDNVTKQVYDFCNKSHALQYQSMINSIMYNGFCHCTLLCIKVNFASYPDAICHALLKGMVEFMTFAIGHMLKNLSIAIMIKDATANLVRKSMSVTDMS